MHTQAAPHHPNASADRLPLSSALRASLGLAKYAPLAPDDERVVASATWIAREEAWSLVLADPTAWSRAVAVLEAASRADVSEVRKDKADKRALLDALSTEVPKSIALADKDDTILRLAVDVIAPHLAARARSCLVRIDAAVAKMERHNVRLVLHVIKRFFADALHRFEVGDLLAWGMPGLRTACLRYDIARGWRFSTFACYWIRHSIGRAIIDYGEKIRIPVHLVELHKKVAGAVRHLKSTGAACTDETIAAYIGKTVTVVRTARATMFLNSGPSLSQTLGGDDSEDARTMLDLLADEDAVDEAAFAEADQRRHKAQVVDDAMCSVLSDDERFILDCRFGLSRDADEPDTLSEIGEVLGVSRERVRQKEKEALGKVRRRVAKAGGVT